MAERDVGEKEGQKSSKKTKRSEYFKELDKEHSSRYITKISIIENVDPYTLTKADLSTYVELFPAVSYPDMVNYFLSAPSPMSSEELKCYKSLAAYNHFQSGWVKEVGVRLFKEEKTLVIGRVSSSKVYVLSWVAVNLRSRDQCS